MLTSLNLALQTCLHGFNTDVDCHHLIFPDAMHNTSCGLIKHLFDVTEQALQASGQYNIVKERFKEVPSYMDLHLPTKRLCAKNITAAQRHSLGACMPVCLLGLVDMEPYCHAFTGARLLCRSCLLLWQRASACLLASSAERPSSLAPSGQPVHAESIFRPQPLGKAFCLPSVRLHTLLSVRYSPL